MNEEDEDAPVRTGLSEATMEELLNELESRCLACVFRGLRKDSKNVDEWMRLVKGGSLLHVLPAMVQTDVVEALSKAKGS